MNIEEDVYEIVNTINRRIDQIDNEIDRYEDEIQNIFIENNRWNELRNNCINLVRVITACSGLLLINFAQLNINYNSLDNIYNQLGINNHHLNEFIDVNNNNENNDMNIDVIH